MTSEITTATATAANDCGALENLAASLEATAGYLESCAERHSVTGVQAARYQRAVASCQRIASDMRNLKDDNPALIHFRSIVSALNQKQLRAFARIKIDYQARIGSEFMPTTTNRFLSELSALAFALEAIHEPACVIGVGVGFGPRSYPSTLGEVA
jgi:hypothetical protein